ncbi:XRE family transcriptional regulator [Pseudooceanicola spongiae]|uniref:XRE family transcriptional regulator n=1 Tax=Pseudooceanicola spongiae TaxID=2613965 RepID=UPI001D013F07|nr:S24 family peptidase [Pseudooceanicola spongiae]
MNQSTAKVEDIERGARLREERERLGQSQTLFAKAAGASKGSQILYEKGRAPTADYLAAIGELGADIIYVLTGRKGQDIEPRLGTSVRNRDGQTLRQYRHAVQPVSDGIEIAEVSEDEASSESFVALPFYSEVAASAGPGKTAPSEYSDSVIAFTRDFLDGLGANPDQCSVIRASGDSMHPSIPDGSLLTVDHSQTEVRNGHIMVISLSDDLLVKRIRRRLDGLVDLISDNNAYPPETIGRDMISQLRVVGRVVYFCRVP